MCWQGFTFSWGITLVRLARAHAATDVVRAKVSQFCAGTANCSKYTIILVITNRVSGIGPTEKLWLQRQGRPGYKSSTCPPDQDQPG